MQNQLKTALAAGQSLHGIWISLSSPIVAEIVGDAGFDWVLIDCEHAPNDLPALRRAASGYAWQQFQPIGKPPVERHGVNKTIHGRRRAELHHPVHTKPTGGS